MGSKIFTEVVVRGLRADVWVWLGGGSPKWSYSAADRPPMPSQAKSAALQSGRSAIIHRKLGQRDEEIAVLKRWLRLCPAGQRDGSQIGQRLAKLNA